MIEIYKCVLRPQLLPQFFAGYDVALALKKRQENLEGLLLQLYSAAFFPQLARPLVHFEGSKADNPGLISIRHCQPRIASVALKTRFPGVRAGYVSLLRVSGAEIGARVRKSRQKEAAGAADAVLMQIEWSEGEVLKSAGVGTEGEVEVVESVGRRIDGGKRNAVQRALDLAQQMHAETLPQCMASIHAITTQAALQPPRGLAGLRELADLLESVQRTLSNYPPRLYTQNLESMLHDLSPGRDGGLAAAWAFCTSGAYRRARGALNRTKRKSFVKNPVLGSDRRSRRSEEMGHSIRGKERPSAGGEFTKARSRPAKTGE